MHLLLRCVSSRTSYFGVMVVNRFQKFKRFNGSISSRGLAHVKVRVFTHLDVVFMKFYEFNS